MRFVATAYSRRASQNEPKKPDHPGSLRDSLTPSTDDVFSTDSLGFRLTERIVLDISEEAGMWLTATNKSYDFAYTKEAHGI
jgi:catechol 2,3-dioxygenase